MKITQPFSLDYQVHSFRSHDGRASVREHCLRAVAIGLTEIGFSEHKDTDPEDKYTAYFDDALYSQEIEAAQNEFNGQLIIRKGIEIDYQKWFEKDIPAFLNVHQFDYVMGTVHFLDRVVIMSPEYNEGKTREEAYRGYFMAVLDSVKSGLFDFVGHLEYCNRWGIAAWGAYSPEPFRDLLTEIFTEMIAREMTLEFNTGGLHRGIGVTLPGLETMRLYHELGGRRMTFGSDAHHPDQLAHEFDWAMTHIKEIGEWQFVSFENRKPILRPL